MTGKSGGRPRPNYALIGVDLAKRTNATAHNAVYHRFKSERSPLYVLL